MILKLWLVLCRMRRLWVPQHLSRCNSKSILVLKRNEKDKTTKICRLITRWETSSQDHPWCRNSYSMLAAVVMQQTSSHRAEPLRTFSSEIQASKMAVEGQSECQVNELKTSLNHHQVFSSKISIKTTNQRRRL